LRRTRSCPAERGISEVTETPSRMSTEETARGDRAVCQARRIWSHLLLLGLRELLPGLAPSLRTRAGPPQDYPWCAYVLRFITSYRNVFPQDIVVSEQVRRESVFE